MESKSEELLILAIVGMPGTGKSEVIKTLVKDYDFSHLYYGGITLDEVKKRGLEQNQENEKIVREELRKELGLGAYSIKILPEIEKAISQGKKLIVLESMYNVFEYEIIKSKFTFNFKVLAIYSDFDIRVRRLLVRNERKLNGEQLVERQIDEAKNLGKGAVIAMADFHFINNGSDMRQFELDLESLIEQKLGLKKLV